MTNNYKQDDNKPPVLDAVDIPFRRALLAVARLALDMKERHKLSGAKDPYQEWRQLPDARRRLANAAARHGKSPWTVNTKDGTHLHAVHALWGWLAAVELWEEEQEKIDQEAPCCGAPDATGCASEVTCPDRPGLLVRARPCGHFCGLVAGYCSDCDTQVKCGSTADGYACERPHNHPGFHVDGPRAWK